MTCHLCAGASHHTRLALPGSRAPPLNAGGAAAFSSRCRARSVPATASCAPAALGALTRPRHYHKRLDITARRILYHHASRRHADRARVLLLARLRQHARRACLACGVALVPQRGCAAGPFAVRHGRADARRRVIAGFGSTPSARAVANIHLNAWRAAPPYNAYAASRFILVAYRLFWHLITLP